MKAKVIIEDGITTIQLFPENSFETRVIETAREEESKHLHTVQFKTDYGYHNHSNHRIEIKIENNK